MRIKFLSRYIPNGAFGIAAMIAAVLLCLHPAGNVLRNRALAATESPGVEVLTPLTPQERLRHAATLRKLVVRDPDMLLDLVQDDVGTVFNAPELKRADGPVSQWQYRSASCVLDVWFKAAKDAVVHYEMRPRDRAAQTPPDGAACLKSLIANGQALASASR